MWNYALLQLKILSTCNWNVINITFKLLKVPACNSTEKNCKDSHDIYYSFKHDVGYRGCKEEKSAN